jgi:hypothetical protein
VLIHSYDKITELTQIINDLVQASAYGISKHKVDFSNLCDTSATPHFKMTCIALAHYATHKSEFSNTLAGELLPVVDKAE